MGSLGERRPGVWEVRVAVGSDPVTGRVIQRSVTFYGGAAEAERYRAELAAEYANRRGAARAAPMLTVGELLERWLVADHPWRPTTWAGYRSNASYLAADRDLAGMRVVSLTPRQLRTCFARWSAAGATPSVIAARFAALRAAVGWAYDERIVEYHPIRAMRGPGRVEPRRPLPDDEVRRLLLAASTGALAAVAHDDGRPASRRRRMAAEQDLLLVRLAADTGARRGELVALLFDDLDDRTLRIERAMSGRELGPTKSRRPRTLTVGASTARLWRTLERDWTERAGRRLGPWLFARDELHEQRLSSSTLNHRFSRLRDQAGAPKATLHRLRHSVATFLVARGQILQAQARLGHRDAATTLREYSYALPLTDRNVADAIDAHLDQPVTTETALEPHDASDPTFCRATGDV
jgi:integrase